MKVFGSRSVQIDNLMLIVKIFIEWIYLNDLIIFRTDNILRI